MNIDAAMVLDLEVENHPYFGDIAPPFHPLNYIVAPAFAVGFGPVQHWYFQNRAEADSSDWFRVPDNVEYIVAHNATFELKWLLHRHRDELMRFLKRGGRVLCTQLAEYLLSAQTELYPALSDVAPRYGGTHKIDAVALLWKQGYLTSQIDKALLLEYLTGPNGDIENTRKVFQGQVPRLIANGMWENYLVRCDAMLHNAFCQYFGMHVNRNTANHSKANLEQQIEESTAALAQYLPDDLPNPQQWNWGSDYHVSALLFGGPIAFDVKVPYDPPQWEKIDCWLFRSGEAEVWLPVLDDNQFKDLEQRASRDEEALGLWAMYVTSDGFDTYTRGKHKGMRRIERRDSTTPKLKWGEAVYVFPGLIHFDDLPDDVAKQFTDTRGEFRGKRNLCDGKTPVYSTSGDALELLAIHSEHPIMRELEDLADCLKIYGTYYVGLLANVDEEDILRAPINNCSTVTTRLSSKLQQMPRVTEEEQGDGSKKFTVGSQVKEMLDSRFPGGHITEVDYTALEVVHLATLSGDKLLLNALLEKTDMHLLRLSAKWHRYYEELLSIYSDRSNPEYLKVKTGRQDQKPMSFQFQYGGTAKGMVYKIKGLTLEAAEEFIQNELRLFPESSKFRYTVESAVLADAKTQPYVREQYDTGGFRLYKRATWVAPSGTRYSFRQYPKVEWINGRRICSMQFKISQLANYGNQGESSLVMQVATALIIRGLIEVDFYNWKALPISTVHDAEYTDTAPELTRTVGLWIKSIMEYAPKYMATLFPGYAALGIQDIPYPAVPEYGLNMRTKQHLE